METKTYTLRAENFASNDGKIYQKRVEATSWVEASQRVIEHFAKRFNVESVYIEVKKNRRGSKRTIDQV